ncbi:MAG: sigma-70 region 4 domain-containing protein, partial [Solirubrobacteraceae bacterium]
MAALEPLAPDQRAVVSLVLQQGRSYEEIASMLGIAPDAVRARAHAGLAALAPANGLPPEITGPIADYLLGQQPPRDAEATRGLLAESAPARGWAAGVAEHLAGVAPNGLPEVPGVDEPAAAEPPDPPDSTPPADSTPEPTPPADSTPEAGSASAAAPPRASRLGGALLIGGVLVVIAVVLFLVLRGGDDGSDQTVGQEPTATPTATASAAPQAQVADEIALAGAGDAEGQMTVYLQDGVLQFAIQAVNLPGAGNKPYAVWLQKGGEYQRLGFASGAEDGSLVVGGPSDELREQFPQLYATYDKVVVSQETTDTA